MTSPTYIATLKGIQADMTRVDIVREKNRGSPMKDHLAMVADGVGALAWVTIEPKPAEYVAELFGGAQMYGNKVLKEHKDKYGHATLHDSGHRRSHFEQRRGPSRMG